MLSSEVTNLKVTHANIWLAMKIESQPNIQFHQLFSYPITLVILFLKHISQLALHLQGQPQICKASPRFPPLADIVFKASPKSIFIFHLSAEIVILPFCEFILQQISESTLFNLVLYLKRQLKVSVEASCSKLFCRRFQPVSLTVEFIRVKNILISF